MKKFTIEESDAFVNLLAEGFRSAAEKGLLSAAHRTVSHIQNEIIPATKPLPVDRGIYRAGWRAEKIEGGAIVYNDVPYAPVIEDGGKGHNVRIGRAMIQALTEWIIRKGIGSTQTTTKSGKVKVVKATEAAATQIAWLIAKSMVTKGLFQGKGLKVLDRATDRIPFFIGEEVAREIKKAAFK